MRRKDREITDPIKIKDIVDKSTCCRIGFWDAGEVYIVPLNYGYEIKNNTYVFYFHSAKEGRKIELTGKSPNVGFEMDTGFAINEGNTACEYSARFQSIIGNGVMSIVSGMEEKTHALSLIMEHNTGKKEWDFKPEMVDAVAILRLVVTKMSCKEHE